MTRFSSTVAGLGSPTSDGELGVIEVAAGRRERLRWNLVLEAWVGDAKPSMRMVDGALPMANSGVPDTWRYPFGSAGTGPLAPGMGFQIHSVRDAGLLYAAGLRLQERLTAATIGGADGRPPRLALNWYDQQPGDGFLSPAPTNLGVELAGPIDNTRTRFASTGWQDSPIDPLTKQGYPELYVGGSDSVVFSRFNAEHRWVAGTFPGAGGEDGGFPPVDAKVAGWWSARSCPRAHGQAVDAWPDYSGRGSHLIVPSFGVAPVMDRTDPDNPHVAFNGTTHALQSVLPGAQFALAPPCTVFLVLRQRSGGSSPQMWLDAGVILYRADDTNKVNFWLGGGPDLTYNRGSAWPMDFTCITIVSDGADSQIYEGRTLKVTGDAGPRGVGAFTLGANIGGSLFARIDVRDLVVFSDRLTGGERASVWDSLEVPV